VWLALVVFTSGIVDEGPFSGSWPPQYYPSSLLVGVEPGGRGGGGVVVAHCWALRDQARTRRREPAWCAALVSCASFVLVRPVGWGGGLVGVHLDDLNSGREHLATDLHQGPSQSKSL